MVDHAGLNSDGHNVMCCVLRYKLFMPISLSIQLFTQQNWLSVQLYVFCVYGGHLLGYELNFLFLFLNFLYEFPLFVLHQTFPHHTHAQIPEIALLYRQTFFWQMAAKSQNNRGKNAGTSLKASLKRFFTLYIPWKSSCFDTEAMSLFFWTVSKKTQIYNYCLVLSRHFVDILGSIYLDVIKSVTWPQSDTCNNVKKER